MFGLKHSNSLNEKSGTRDWRVAGGTEQHFRRKFSKCEMIAEKSDKPNGFFTNFATFQHQLKAITLCFVKWTCYKTSARQSNAHIEPFLRPQLKRTRERDKIRNVAADYIRGNNIFGLETATILKCFAYIRERETEKIHIRNAHQIKRCEHIQEHTHTITFTKRQTSNVLSSLKTKNDIVSGPECAYDYTKTTDVMSIGCSMCFLGITITHIHTNIHWQLALVAIQQGLPLFV